MFKANKPTETDLPSAGQLVRSTLLAIGAAIVILVTIVLPSEYAIDPTGIGRALGLTQMGQVKQRLAADAHGDAQVAEQVATSLPASPVDTAHAPPEQTAPATAEPPAPIEVPAAGPAAEAAAQPAAGRADEVSVTLKPSQGTEYKLSMQEGAKASFEWSVAGGQVNYDLHGTAVSGKETSYRKGREVQTDSGELVAAFDGAHGWYWRNRGTQDVTITLRTKGDYSELKHIK